MSPTSLSVVEGERPAVSIAVAGQNGFTGSVTVTPAGLPEGATSSPATPFSVTSGASEQVTFSIPLTAPLVSYSITVRGSSGAVSHDALLTLTVAPVVRTYQQGSRLYLEVQGGNETARVGLETQWGGSIVEVSLNGTNFVNEHDTGREVQPAFYDGSAQYDSCAGCTGVFGWDPVQGGDKYDHGSPVLTQSLAADSIFVKTQPYQWNPDDKGGGPSQPVLSDTYYEQTLSPVSNHARAFKAHYKVTHFGADRHSNSPQEFPAVYVSLGFDRFVRYGGSAPWTNDAVTIMAPAAGSSPNFYNPEQWAALVNEQGVGLTVYIPGQLPYNVALSFPGAPGPTGDGTNYFAPFTSFTFAPGAVLEGDIYLIAGDYKAARQVVYDLNKSISTSDIFTPFGFMDTPRAGSQVSASIDVAGWAFDNVAVAKVEVFVDSALAGNANYGLARPDVAGVYPNAPVNVGFEYTLDTTRFANGAHALGVKVTDTSGNVAVFPPVTVSITN